MELKKFGRYVLSSVTGLLVMLVVFCMHPVTVQAEESGNVSDSITWRLDDNKVLHIEGSGAMPNWDNAFGYQPWYQKEVVAVEVGDGITAVGDRSFYQMSYLQKVTLPSSVTSIGEEGFATAPLTEGINLDNVSNIGKKAFQGCATTSMTIKKGTVDEYAFDGMGNLDTVTLGADVTAIAAYAFNGCNGLKFVVNEGEETSWDALQARINIGAGNECLTSAYLVKSGSNIIYGSDVTWERDGSRLILGGTGDMPRYVTENAGYYPYQASPEGVTEIIVNEGVTYLSEYAFSMFPNVSSVSLPNSLRAIGSFAFKGLNNLTEVTIPSGQIQESAFINCANLATVNIGAGVTEIGISAFEGCNSITKVNISDIASWCNIDFGGVYANPINRPASILGQTHLYLNGNLITNLEIPSGVTSIPDYAFTNCPDIQSVSIPASVKTIGQAAFSNDTSLTTVTGDSGLVNIGAAAFAGTKITSFEFGSNLEYIGSYAFKAVPLAGMFIDRGYIGAEAFYGCGVMYAGNIGNGVSINNNAFGECGALVNTVPTSSSIPAQVTFKLGNYGGEDIEWKVLTVQDGKALVVSSKVLDYQKFYNDSSANTAGWSGSAVRSWLNGTFYNSVFDETAKSNIITTTVSTGNNTKYGTSGGDASDDKLFFLSADELTSYLTTPDSRKAVTRAANENPGSIDTSSGGTAYYWLRDSGIQNDFAAYVDYAGYVHYDGAYTTNPEIFGVRPAMWINASYVGVSSATTTEATSTGHTNAANSPIYDFILRLYIKCLGRIPEWAGYSDWEYRLENNVEDPAGCFHTGAYVARGFFLSPEMTNKGLSDSDYTEVLYEVMMNRASDPDGKSYWLNCLANGVSREGALRGFAESAEFGEICNNYGVVRGSLTDVQPRDVNFGITMFVARCYTKALGRNFDVDGLNDWCQQINSAPSVRAKAIEVSTTGFFDSQEFINKGLDNDAFVDVLYETFLGRSADAAGKADWVRQLNEGADRHQIMAGFYNSQEFDEIMNSYGITN